MFLTDHEHQIYHLGGVWLPCVQRTQLRSDYIHAKLSDCKVTFEVEPSPCFPLRIPFYVPKFCPPTLENGSYQTQRNFLPIGIQTDPALSYLILNCFSPYPSSFQLMKSNQPKLPSYNNGLSTSWLPTNYNCNWKHRVNLWFLVIWVLPVPGAGFMSQGAVRWTCPQRSMIAPSCRILVETISQGGYF